MQCGTVKIRISASRFAGLGYAKIQERCWRFVDLESDEATGGIYPTRAELLADLPTFAAAMGYEEAS